MQRQNIRVAIVDDNTLALKQIEFLMKRIPNTETHCFSSPNYFVVMLLSRPIDIAIIDINMPELDGIRILRILANECFRSPILIHSAVNDNLLSDIKKFAISSGLKIIGILKKPTSFVELSKYIEIAFSLKNHRANELIQENKMTPFLDTNEPNISQIHKAIVQNDFFLVIQPKIDISKGKCAGGEFLIRWKTMKYPVESIIRKIEQTNLIDLFSINVINQAFDALKLNKEKISGLSFSFNLSTKNLESDIIIDLILDKASSANINSKNIVIEVTETSFIGDSNLCIDKLLRLRLAGFQVSLDDFGTGFSTLKQLQSLPFSEIKIDKSFVQNFDEIKSAEIIRSISTLAASLNLKVVAEGIENKQQEDFCKQCGILFGQGYYYSKPISIADFFSNLHKPE